MLLYTTTYSVVTMPYMTLPGVGQPVLLTGGLTLAIALILTVWLTYRVNRAPQDV